MSRHLNGSPNVLHAGTGANRTASELPKGRTTWRDPDSPVLEWLEKRCFLSAYFFDARIVDLVDLDGDGYVSQFRVEWDVDETLSSYVYVDLYENDLFADDYLGFSDNWLASGSLPDWRGVTLDTTNFDLPGDDSAFSWGTVELRLDLVDWATNLIVDSITELDDLDLGNILVESLLDDIPLPPVAEFSSGRIVNAVDLDTDGFVSSFDIEWDVDVTNGSRAVYVAVVEEDGLSDDLVFVSTAWDAVGSGTDWRGVTIDADQFALPGNDMDGGIELRLDLFDAFTNERLDTIRFSELFVESRTLDNAAPTVPGSPWVVDMATSNATLLWGPSSDLEFDPITYRVEYREYQSLFPDPWSLAGETSATSMVLTGLRQDALYDVRIKAFDDRGGESEWSAESNQVILPVYIEHRLSDGASNFADPNPLKTVWLVIHGRNGSPDPGDTASENISRLADAMTGIGDQVFTVDWSVLAAEGFLDFAGERWILPVARQVANQLIDWGMANAAINIVGHSWGAVMAAEIASYLGGIHDLIALDPAQDASILGSAYDTESIRFDTYTDYSWAFVGSFAGSTQSASSADEAYLFADPNQLGSSYDASVGLWGGLFSGSVAAESHGEVVFAFAQMIEDLTGEQDRGVGAFFDPRYMGIERDWRSGQYDADDLELTVYSQRTGDFDGVIGTVVGLDGHWTAERFFAVLSGDATETVLYSSDSVGSGADRFLSLFDLNQQGGLLRGDWIVNELTLLIPDAAYGQGYWGAENYWFQDSGGDVWGLWHGGPVHESIIFPGQHDWVLTNMTDAAGLRGQFEFAPGSISGIVTGWNAFSIQGVIDGMLVALWWSPESSAETYTDLDGMVKQGQALGVNGNGWVLSDLSGVLHSPIDGSRTPLEGFYSFTASQGLGRTLFDPDLMNASGGDGMSIVVVRQATNEVYLASFNVFQVESVLGGALAFNGLWLIEPLRDVPSLAHLVSLGLIGQYETDYLLQAMSS